MTNGRSELERIANDANALRSFVQECSNAGNLAQLLAFVDACPPGEHHERIADALLRKDDMAMAAKCMPRAVVNHWALRNLDVVLSQAPNVFAYWARPVKEIVQPMLAHFDRTLDFKQKEQLLAGQVSSYRRTGFERHCKKKRPCGVKSP